MSTTLWKRQTQERFALYLTFHVSNAGMISKKFTSEAKDHILKGHIFKENYFKKKGLCIYTVFHIAQ